MEKDGKVRVETAVLTVAKTLKKTTGAVYRPTSVVVQKAPMMSLSALALTALTRVMIIRGRANL
ncbi:MAG: hypothetical protein A4E30_00858 [Methanomassiliicoccales archaeon PtaB.Bin215]|nr:MAG: hypothetical protein A4E30_00858 [Methanomassiliicoccales archaeon PtaB.Bin215]